MFRNRKTPQAEKRLSAIWADAETLLLSKAKELRDEFDNKWFPWVAEAIEGSRLHPDSSEILEFAHRYRQVVNQVSAHLAGQLVQEFSDRQHLDKRRVEWIKGIIANFVKDKISQKAMRGLFPRTVLMPEEIESLPGFEETVSRLASALARMPVPTEKAHDILRLAAALRGEVKGSKRQPKVRRKKRRSSRIPAVHRRRLGKEAIVHRQAPTPSQTRARTVAKVIDELDFLRPQVFSESDLERLAKKNPRFLAFRVANKRDDLREKMVNIQAHRRHIRLAQELTAGYYGKRLSTIQTDWKKNKPKQYRSKQG